MVTFINKGRCGNFLYQCATSFCYAKRHGMEFTIPAKTDNEKWNPIYFPWLLNKNYDKTLPQVVLKEIGHNYNPIPFKEKYRQWNVVLDGYWQSFRYIDDYRDDVLEAFRIPYQPLNGFVGIHIRRGDYVQLPQKHILQTYDWLKTCVLYFVERGYKSFVVCSDDLPWSRKTLEPLRVYGAEFSFSETNDEIQDLALLSCCEHQISSSSTFSVWSAWLNRNPSKTILIPDKWFGPGEKLNTKDIVPESWIKIPI